MENRPILLSVVVLVATAGCLGGAPTAPSDDSATTEPTVSPEPTPSDQSVHDFDSLSEVSQATVSEAIEKGESAVTKGKLGASLAEDSRLYVEYRGDVYNVTVSEGVPQKKYQFGRISPVNNATADDASELVRYASLSPESQDTFENVKSGGEAPTYLPKNYPNRLRSNDFVIYDGETYRIVTYTIDSVRYNVSATEYN